MFGTKHIAIFVVCLAASAVLVQAVGFGSMVDNPDTGIEDQVSDTGDDVQKQDVERDQLGDGIVGNIYAALGTLTQIFTMILLFPQALINLGLDRPYTLFVLAPLSLVLGISFLQFLAGRRLE